MEVISGLYFYLIHDLIDLTICLKRKVFSPSVFCVWLDSWECARIYKQITGKKGKIRNQCQYNDLLQSCMPKHYMKLEAYSKKTNPQSQNPNIIKEIWFWANLFLYKLKEQICYMSLKIIKQNLVKK